MQVQHERVHLLTTLSLSNVISKFCSDNNFSHSSSSSTLVMSPTNISMESLNIMYRTSLLSSGESFCWQVNLQHRLSWHMELLTDVTTRVALDGYLRAVLLDFFFTVRTLFVANKFFDGVD